MTYYEDLKKRSEKMDEKGPITLEVLEVKGLIDKLRAADTGYRLFCAESHRYRIGPKLSEGKILKFEKDHGITLPEDYRLYLQLVGNGYDRWSNLHDAPSIIAGAGPGYGIYPLSNIFIGKALNQPFPFEEEVEVPYEPPYDAWEGDIPGAMEISTEGCASHTHLIVKGAAFGTIWEGWEAHFIPTNLTFIQWMRNWAETALRVFGNEPLVKKIKLGMKREHIETITGVAWRERKRRVWNERMKKFSQDQEYILEAPGIAAQLVMSGPDGIVTKINRDWVVFNGALNMLKFGKQTVEQGTSPQDSKNLE
jgi:hypothetical protein